MVNNMNITENISVVYDPEIILKIKEMIKEGFEKLKSFVNIKSSKFDAYYELEEKFNNIANILRDIESLNDEFEYFLFIKRKILHIVYQNCEDENYGHCDYALELFDFFMEIWDARIKLNREFIQEELELYKEQQISFKKRCHEYRREFYCNIYKSNGEFSEEEMYKIHESLRD